MNKEQFLAQSQINLPSKISWPPDATEYELRELSEQRNKDIGIKWLTGPIKAFEEEFRRFLWNKIQYSVTYNSGTSWLLAAYFAIWLKQGDELIGPALTYHAALSPAFILGAKVKLCDVDKDTRCIKVDKIEELITPKTKAITIVHQWWHPCDMEKIMNIAKKYSLFVIEDCSHAHGSSYRWQMCWTFGDVAVFSLQTNKAIFAWEGGILVTNNIGIYERATLLWHYRDRSKTEVKSKELHDLWPTWYGLKLRMSPFNAIVASHSLKNFENIKNGRHRCLKYLNERLQEVPYIIPLSIDHNNIDMWAWYGFKPCYNPNILNIDIHVLVSIFNDFCLDIDVPSGGSLTNYRLYTSNKNVLFDSVDAIKNNLDSLPNTNYLDNYSFSFPTFYNWDEHRKIIDVYIDILKYIYINIDKIRSIWNI